MSEIAARRRLRERVQVRQQSAGGFCAAPGTQQEVPKKAPASCSSPSDGKIPKSFIGTVTYARQGAGWRARLPFWAKRA